MLQSYYILILIYHSYPEISITIDTPDVGICWRWIVCTTIEGQLELCLQALPCSEGTIKARPALDKDDAAALAVAR